MGGAAVYGRMREKVKKAGPGTRRARSPLASDKISYVANWGAVLSTLPNPSPALGNATFKGTAL